MVKKFRDLKFTKKFLNNVNIYDYILRTKKLIKPFIFLKGCERKHCYVDFILFFKAKKKKKKKKKKKSSS